MAYRPPFPENLAFNVPADVAHIRVSKLRLLTRVSNSLESEGIWVLGDFQNITLNRLWLFRCIGEKTMVEIREKLAELGITESVKQ